MDEGNTNHGEREMIHAIVFFGTGAVIVTAIGYAIGCGVGIVIEKFRPAKIKEMTETVVEPDAMMHEMIYGK